LLLLTALTALTAVAGGSDDVESLLKTLSRAEAEANELGHAVRQLGDMRSVEAVEPLAKLLRHRNEHVRDEAMYSLVRIGKPSVAALTELTADSTELPATIGDTYRRHEYPGFVSSTSPLGWRQLGSGKLYGPVGLYVSRYAIRALGLIGGRESLPAIDSTESRFAGNRFIRDEYRRARIAILGKDTVVAADMRPWMLAEIGGPQAAMLLTESITRNLRHTSSGVIAEKFGAYDDIGGNTPADDIRRIDGLGCMQATAGRRPLLRLITNGVRNDWQWFHAGMHDLVDHFHGIGVGWDGHWMAVAASCRAVGEMGDKAAIPELKKRLSDKNIIVRLNAARALARLGDDAGLQTALDDMRWMHVEFVSDYDRKGKPWLQHWVNDDPTAINNDGKYPGKTWFRPVPSYQYLLACDTLGYIGNITARDALRQRAQQILDLRLSKSFNEYYQTDLLWLAVALKRIGADKDAKRALDGGMQLFSGDRAIDVELRHFHVAALPALAMINDPGTLDAVGRVLTHHQTTWRPGVYDVRDLAWGVYLTLVGRRDPGKPLRCSELCWLH
jgi:HEAT repeat protein